MQSSELLPFTPLFSNLADSLACNFHQLSKRCLVSTKRQLQLQQQSMESRRNKILEGYRQAIQSTKPD